MALIVDSVVMMALELERLFEKRYFRPSCGSEDESDRRKYAETIVKSVDALLRGSNTETQITHVAFVKLGFNPFPRCHAMARETLLSYAGPGAQWVEGQRPRRHNKRCMARVF